MRPGEASHRPMDPSVIIPAPMGLTAPSVSPPDPVADIHTVAVVRCSSVSPWLRRCLWMMLVAPALVPGVFASDTEYRPGLEVVGEVDGIEVSPSGEIWFGTSKGKVYRSRNWNESWQEVGTPIGAEQSPFRDNDTIYRVRFF